MTNRTTLGDVYEQLYEDGFVDHDHTINEAAFNTENNSPWFIQGLMGCGGWLAAVFMLGVVSSCFGTFLYNMGEAGIGIICLFIGAIFTIATAVHTRDNDEIGVFVSQLLLSIHLAGHLLLIFGFTMAFQLWNTDTDATIVLIYTIILQAVFITWYQNAIYRFVAMLIISSALYGIATVHELPLLTSLFTGALTITGILIWVDRLPVRWQIHHLDMLHPIGYGAMIGAFGLMISEVTNRYYYYEAPPDTTYITTAILFLCLLWVEMELLKAYKIRLTSPIAIFIYFTTAIIALPLLGVSWTSVTGPGFDTVGTPGILAGVVGILLAFRRRNRILLGISYAYMAGFIIYYYYWLDVTLLTKSIILMVTGGLMIATRPVIRQMVKMSENTEGHGA